jgi:D-alanyl-lipoteichoic acid acyltransferase DltB (MBOAT superfamily)
MLVWGGLHGVYQVVERLLLTWKPTQASSEQPAYRQVLSMVIVFIFVALAFVSFGSGSFGRALLYWTGMVTAWGKPAVIKPVSLVEPALAVLMSLALDLMQYKGKDETAMLKYSRFAQAGLLVLVILVFLYQAVIDEGITASFVYQGF